MTVVIVITIVKIFAETCTHLTALIADVPDDALTASSSFREGINSSRSRLHTQDEGGHLDLDGAWVAQYNTLDQYIQVKVNEH